MKHVLKYVANIAIAVLTIALLMGCGEEPDGLVLDDNETLGLLGSLRTPENAPSAPMNIAAIGTPRVISVGYYSDWKLTKEIQSAEAGETVFIKIVFSEPMEHIVTGEGSGRPVLWYKERGSPMERFKVTSPKEKLIHGYAKPLGSGTDDYICRYVMPDTELSIMVGKLSADLDGNTLTKFYHHPKKLQVTQSDTIEPTSPAQSEPLEPAEIIDISYYLDQDLTHQLFQGDKVAVGDSVYSKVTFSKSVPIVVANNGDARPVILYSDDEPLPDGSVLFKRRQYHIKPSGANLASGEAKSYRGSTTTFVCRYIAQLEDAGGFFFTLTDVHEFIPDVDISVVYRLPRSDVSGGETVTRWSHRDFTGVVYTLSRESKQHRFKTTPVVGATVTITAGERVGDSTLTDTNGRYLFRDIRQNELLLRVDKEYFEPREVIAFKSRNTLLPDKREPHPHIATRDVDMQKKHGDILIGNAWPDEVRFILDETVVISDLLFIADEHASGQYLSGLCLADVSGYSVRYARIVSTVAHEIAHAHQHALALRQGYRGTGTSLWKVTSEGSAYVEAMYKDVGTFGKLPIDETSTHGIGVPHENAAIVSSIYWSIGRWNHGNSDSWTIQLHNEFMPKMPNRLKWAEEWLSKKYE